MNILEQVKQDTRAHYRRKLNELAMAGGSSCVNIKRLATRLPLPWKSKSLASCKTPCVASRRIEPYRAEALEKQIIAYRDEMARKI